MAQNYLNTGVQAGNREDLKDYIRYISYKMTPFLSSCGKGDAKGIKHDWMTQAIRAGATNVRGEGYSPTFAAGDITPRVRRVNQLQILANPFSVSGTQEWVDKAGLSQGSEYDEQKDLKFKELANDLDFDLISNTIVTRAADNPTSGEMDGILAWASGSRNIAADSDLLTEDLYNTLGEAIYNTSGETADATFVRGFQKRAITGWTTPYRKHETGNKKYVNSVATYDGDYGVQDIIIDLNIPVASTIFMVKIGYCVVAYGRPAFHKELGSREDERRGFVLTEATLEMQNPNTVGQITGLATNA